MKFENPIEKNVVKFSIILFVIFFPISIIFLLLRWGPYSGLLSFLVIFGYGFTYLSINWYWEFYKRPKTVDIVDAGLILYTNYSGDIVVNWTDLLGYYSFLKENDNRNKSKGGVGLIVLKNGRSYKTTYFIALTVAAEYHRITGHLLPVIKRGESVRGFKKRLSNDVVH